MGLLPERLPSLDYWLQPASDPTGNSAYLALAVGQAVLFFGAVVARLLADVLFGPTSPAYAFACRCAVAAGLLGASGLVVLLFRWQPAPVLSMRLWLLLWWVGLATTLTWSILRARAIRLGPAGARPTVA